MDDTIRIDLTDWATLLEALDGARAPFAALSAITATWTRSPSRGRSEAAPPSFGAPPGVNWRLEP